MQKQTKTYFRSFYISFIIIICILLGWLGISSAYQNIVKTLTGEYKTAIKITNDTITILDFEIHL